MSVFIKFKALSHPTDGNRSDETYVERLNLETVETYHELDMSVTENESTVHGINVTFEHHDKEYFFSSAEKRDLVLKRFEYYLSCDLTDQT